MKKKMNIRQTAKQMWKERHGQSRFDQAVAWEVVWEFCLKLGMRAEKDESAIEAVLRFIYERGQK